MRAVRATCLIVGIACACALGQEASKRLEFEVASVKPSPPPGTGPMRFGIQGGPGSSDPGRLTCSHATLSYLLTYAYDVRRNQISGTQEWMDRDMFDVAAKVPEGATKEQVRTMLQNLLIDRFRLAAHRETKEMPIYALIVAKGRPKVEPAENAAPATTPKPDAAPSAPVRLQMGPDGCPEVRVPPGASSAMSKGFMIFMNGRACLTASSQTMTWLAEQLTPRLGRLVVDMTGLKGEYAFRLRFDPGGAAAPGPMAPPPPGKGDTAARPVPDTEPFPDVFAAVQEQLGLKLESRKGPVDLLVIDHLEKTPTEN